MMKYCLFLGQYLPKMHDTLFFPVCQMGRVFTVVSLVKKGSLLYNEERYDQYDNLEAYMNRIKCLGLIVLQAVLRLAFMLLLYFALTGKDTVVMGIAAGAVLLLLLMPLRFIIGKLMRGKSQGIATASYFKRLWQGCLRFLRGSVFSLPFFGLVGYFLHLFYTQPFNKVGQFLQKFSVLVGKEPSVDTGLLGYLIVLAVLLVIAVLGWRRDLPMEYVYDSAGKTTGELIRATRDIRRNGRGRLLWLTVSNFVIALPGLAVFGIVLVPYFYQQLSMAGGNMMMILQLLLDMLKKPLPQEQILWLAGGYALIYVPLHAWRKMRTAKTVRKIG